MDEEIILISIEESGERIDALLARKLPEISRSQLQHYFDDGLITIDGKKIKKNYRPNVGELVSVELPPLAEVELVAQNIPLDIVYEDDDIIVVNKPRGMVVHPAPGHPDGTLVNALMYHCGDSLSGIGGERRPGIVHRIDKDTSGLIASAKNDFAHQGLAAQLADHSMYREYEAVVRGNFKVSSGTVDCPIGRDVNDRKRMAVTDKNSKPAVTHWELAAAYRGYSHIICRLETGRTHQIRVHMAHIGHPLLGDGVYGAPCPEKGLEGQCLHARRLSLVHPRSGERMYFEAARPEYFEAVLSKLGCVLEEV